MKRVVIESPYAGDVVLNTRYLHACILDSLRRGEAPYASHGFLPNFLDDQHPGERILGIEAGLAWAQQGDLRAVYTDLGITEGMLLGIQRAEQQGQSVERRSIPRWRDDPALPATTTIQPISRDRIPLQPSIDLVLRHQAAQQMATQKPTAQPKQKSAPITAPDPTQQPIETVPRSGLPNDMAAAVSGGQPERTAQPAAYPAQPGESVSEAEIDLLLKNTGSTPIDTY